MHKPCRAPTPAQALGLIPLPDPSSPADTLETSMALRSSGQCAGGAFPIPHTPLRRELLFSWAMNECLVLFTPTVAPKASHILEGIAPCRCGNDATEIVSEVLVMRR